MKRNVSGQHLFAAIKATTASRDGTLVLPVGSPLVAVLRPISTLKENVDPTDVQLLTQWRNLHVKSFLTEFLATEAQTSRWLSESVHVNGGKLLFMVDLPNGDRVGHVGLGFIDWEKSYGEADAIVSGGKSPPGLMKASLLTLMRWARDVLGLETLAVRVRSDNTAVDFYRKVGFQEVKRIPIVATSVDGGVNWSEDPLAVDAEPTLVYMRLDLNE